MEKDMTAEELAKRAHDARPDVVYRAAADGASVAAWSVKLGRWVPVAGRSIMPAHPWLSLDYELLVNGKPAFEQAIYGDAPEAARGPQR